MSAKKDKYMLSKVPEVQTCKNIQHQSDVVIIEQRTVRYSLLHCNITPSCTLLINRDVWITDQENQLHTVHEGLFSSVVFVCQDVQQTTRVY